uniref:Short coiled-coil protein n=1 Tax=Syphacia muris TaxID=451379 RepID=A0A0N5AGM9_9BILA
MASTTETERFPLADEDTGGRTPKPAQPLPKEETAEDQEEKARLIAQILELQNTLDDLSARVDSVKEESLKLRSENQVLGQYIQNLMSSSSVFQSFFVWFTKTFLIICYYYFNVNLLICCFN